MSSYTTATEKPSKAPEDPGYIQLQTAARRIKEINDALSNLNADINSGVQEDSDAKVEFTQKSLLAVLRELSGEINKDVDGALVQIQSLSNNLLT